MNKILEVIEQALDAADVKHDGIDTGSACIYADLVPSSALVFTARSNEHGDFAVIEVNTWDASGGLDSELLVGEIRPDLAGVVAAEFIRTRGETEEDWG